MSLFIDKIVNELHKDMRENGEWIEGTHRYAVDLSEIARRKHVEIVKEIFNKVLDRRIEEMEATISYPEMRDEIPYYNIRIDELNKLKGDGE